MRLARFKTGNGYEIFASHGDSWISLSGIEGYATPTRLGDLLDPTRLSELSALLGSLQDVEYADIHLDQAATVVDTGDVWGAGLNYKGHSEDLNTRQPSSGPGSYLRPSSCLIGNGQEIELPTQSKRVTAEAELGLVIGTECKNVPRDEWRSVVAGVTSVLDLTAEDVIRENPRYIPWAKGFDTFCSVGPQIVSLGEFDDAKLQSIQVSTILNGETVASAPLADMKYDLGFLVEYFTAGRTFSPGTVICTGTPGAAVINPGDSIVSVVEGIGVLSHTVKG
ncbi:fumarylacetoacetate hydrolase family protein [Streptomyces sp. NPDC050433]|uniref:fumarylacetoacetate hydrolase family protein n=1 Tax=Streptomyces sp. NPDC050433 TaxID=3365615 RepID=UPI0037ADA54D